MRIAKQVFNQKQVLARDKPWLYSATRGAFRASTQIAILAKKYSSPFMYWDVKKIVSIQECKLYLEMEDGRSGYFDVTPLLKNKFFAALKDTNYFKQVKIVLGALTWPNEEDIDPEIVMKDFVSEPCSCVAEKGQAYGES